MIALDLVEEIEHALLEHEEVEASSFNLLVFAWFLLLHRALFKRLCLIARTSSLLCKETGLVTVLDVRLS